jgi:ABC-2 type transport system permease protein
VEPEAGAESVDSLNRRVAGGELFAYFVVPRDPLAEGAQLRYVSTNITDEELRTWFSRLAGDEVRERRLATERIAPEIAARVQRPVAVTLTRLDDEGREAPVEDEDMLRAWAPAAFTYILWMAVFALSQGLLISTIEEKSSRVIEVLLSSVSSRQLMAGKIAGVMATGLVTVAVWAGCFFLIAFFLPDIADRWLGLGRVELDLASVAAEPTYIASFLIYFLLAYLFYATLLVGIGSLCNTVQEAQNLMAPVMVMMMVPLLIVMSMPEDPNSTLARVLSYIPPFTPFVMMGRAAATPPMTEYLVTTLLLLAAIALIFVAAAKVFETGILVTDKRPPMREVMRWIREPGGRRAGMAADG